MKTFTITLTIFLTVVNMTLSQNCLIEELEKKRIAFQTLSGNSCPGLCLTNEQADEVLYLLKSEDSLKIELKTCEDQHNIIDKKYQTISKMHEESQINLELSRDKNKELSKKNNNIEQENKSLKDKNSILKKITTGSTGLSILLIIILIL